MKMRSKQGYTKSRKRSKSFAKVSIGRLLRSSGRTTKIICPGDRWNQPAILSALRFLLPGISRAQPLVMFSVRGLTVTFKGLPPAVWLCTVMAGEHCAVLSLNAALLKTRLGGTALKVTLIV